MSPSESMVEMRALSSAGEIACGLGHDLCHCIDKLAPQCCRVNPYGHNSLPDVLSKGLMENRGHQSRRRDNKNGVQSLRADRFCELMEDGSS